MYDFTSITDKRNHHCVVEGRESGLRKYFWYSSRPLICDLEGPVPQHRAGHKYLYDNSESLRLLIPAIDTKHRHRLETRVFYKYQCSTLGIRNLVLQRVINCNMQNADHAQAVHTLDAERSSSVAESLHYIDLTTPSSRLLDAGTSAAHYTQRFESCRLGEFLSIIPEDCGDNSEEKAWLVHNLEFADEAVRFDRFEDPFQHQNGGRPTVAARLSGRVAHRGMALRSGGPPITHTNKAIRHETLPYCPEKIGWSLTNDLSDLDASSYMKHLRQISFELDVLSDHGYSDLSFKLDLGSNTSDYTFKKKARSSKKITALSKKALRKVMDDQFAGCFGEMVKRLVEEKEGR